MRCAIAGVIAIVATGLPGCIYTSRPNAALEDPIRLQAKDAFVHGPSGVSFPERIGPFARSDLTQYDADGRNVSVGYDIRGGMFSMSATVYVYPGESVGSFLADGDQVAEWTERVKRRELESNKAAIREGHAKDGMEEVFEDVVTVESRGGRHRGTKTSWDFTNALGTPGLRGTTHLYLFMGVGGEWIVKFRITHPRGIDVTKPTDTLFRGLAWPGE